MPNTARIAALESIVAKFEKMETEFATMREEMKKLPVTPGVEQMLLMNQANMNSTRLSVRMAHAALERERSSLA